MKSPNSIPPDEKPRYCPRCKIKHYDAKTFDDKTLCAKCRLLEQLTLERFGRKE